MVTLYNTPLRKVQASKCLNCIRFYTRLCLASFEFRKNTRIASEWKFKKHDELPHLFVYDTEKKKSEIEKTLISGLLTFSFLAVRNKMNHLFSYTF